MSTLWKSSYDLIFVTPTTEPLIECYGALMDRQCVCNLQISNVFERTIQVLPERTHPNVMMPGNRGYVLSGITVTE